MMFARLSRTLPSPWVAWLSLVAGWLLIYFGSGFFGVMLIVVFVALRLTAYERKRSSARTKLSPLP